MAAGALTRSKIPQKTHNRLVPGHGGRPVLLATASARDAWLGLVPYRTETLVRPLAAMVVWWWSWSVG